ncbi:Protein of unknown function [Bacillus mycoides]|nr:Protein of unknown function [Bacillus mycoides]
MKGKAIDYAKEIATCFAQ